MKAKKRLLEIGPGATPVAFAHKARQRILLDSNVGIIHLLKRTYGSKARYIIADFKKMPLKEESISRIECRMPAFMTELPIVTRPEFTTHAALSEVRRVLKKGGVITISVDPPNKDLLKETFIRAGFRFVKEKAIFTKPQAAKKATEYERIYQRIFKQYGGLSAQGKPGITLIKFKKV